LCRVNTRRQLLWHLTYETLMRYISVLFIAFLVAVAASSAVAQQCTEVRVHSVHLQGNTALRNADIERVVRSVPIFKSKDGLRELSERFRMAYQDLGYYKAEVSDPEVQATVKGLDRYCHFDVVDVSVAVKEGRVYRLGGIHFKGGTIFPPAKYRESFSLADGDVFKRSAIVEGLERLRELYCGAGYINFISVPDVDFDEQRGLISLVVDMGEGKQYRWGVLIVKSENSVPGARQRLLDSWKPHEGTVCDCGRTLELFLREIGSRPDVKPEQVFQRLTDHHARVVNVRIELADPPSF